MAARCEELARLLLGCTDEEETNAIWKELELHIQFWARLIAKNHAWLREDFVEDSCAKVWEKFHQFDPARGKFRPWVRRILVHDLKDRCRRDIRHKNLFTQGTEGIDWNQNCARACGVAPVHLSAADLDRVRTWPTRVRVHLLLIVGNLWKLAPESEWRSWLAELGLPEDFPPAEFEQFDNLPDRNAAIAAAFGVKRDVVNQWLFRSRRYLAELECARKRLP